MRRARAVWVLRVLWFLLPLTVGAAAGDALASTPQHVAPVATTALWAFWAAGLLASAIPLPVTLTAIRVLAPAVVVVAGWAIADADRSAISWVGVGHGIVTLLAAFDPLVGDRFVDGASYGDERRMLLRIPVPLAIVAVPLTWLAAVAGVATGPLLLAGHRWVAGALATAVGAPLAAVAVRALYQLATRWVVFVPTGMVLHDHMVLTEPVLFRRTAIERLGPAIAGSPARDLSSQAAGLLLECELTDPAPLGLRTRRRGAPADAVVTDVRRFLFSPSRPGELLDEAERRRIPVG